MIKTAGNVFNGIMCMIQQISRGPSKGALHTQLVIILKHWFCFFIKNEYYFVSNPSHFTVKTNFSIRHGPFAFPGKGVGSRWWMGDMICIDSPSGNMKFN